MPFDGKDFNHEEVEILDRMVQILSPPGRWCKRYITKRRCLGFLPSSHCLMGAFGLAADDNDDYVFVVARGSRPIQRVWVALNAAVPANALSDDKNSAPAVEYNDLETTTHGDILALIGRARRHFI